MDPVPSIQLTPLSVLYFQLAPDSSPLTLTVPFVLMPSPAVPVSSASARVGATGARVSIAWLSKLAREVAEIGLPATSRIAAVTLSATLPDAIPEVGVTATVNVVAAPASGVIAVTVPTVPLVAVKLEEVTLEV